MATIPLQIILAEDDDGHATLIRRNLEHVARMVVASHRRCVQGKGDRLSQREFELRLFQRDFLAFFQVLGNDAENCDTISTPRGGAPWGRVGL